MVSEVSQHWIFPFLSVKKYSFPELKENSWELNSTIALTREPSVIDFEVPIGFSWF